MLFERKLLTVTVVVSVLAVSASVILFFIYNSERSTSKTQDVKIDNNNFSCVKEGEYIDHPSKDSFACCLGLSKASALPLDDNCEVIIPENSPGIEPGWTCIKCGDGFCNNQAGESKCNCPEDCGQKDVKSDLF